jgi:hypothetical protein
VNDDRNPLDQLVDLLVYAPIGLLYERDDVLPKLVTRGRSQVQLARVLGELAVRRGQGQLEDRLTDAFGAPGAGLAKLVTELGSLVGLAPPADPDAGTTTPGEDPTAGSRAGGGDAARSSAAGAATGSGPALGTAAEEPPAAWPAEVLAADGGGTVVGTAAEEPPAIPAATAVEEPPATLAATTGGTARSSLPIAGYDRMTARAIVPLLVDLSPSQRAVVRDHELANRGRKTILHQIDRLGS